MNFDTLKKRYEELQELCVWMTAHYDFSQHKEFLEKQHLLSLQISEDNNPVDTAIRANHVKISDLMGNNPNY